MSHKLSIFGSLSYEDSCCSAIKGHLSQRNSAGGRSVFLGYGGEYLRKPLSIIGIWELYRMEIRTPDQWVAWNREAVIGDWCCQIMN